MDRKQLIKKYLDFFKEKEHKEISNASLVPENDPTTLFTGSGVETIIPYVLGQPHPLGKRLTNVQRSVRTGDIEEVGDSYHHTLFEMIGNWSLGDYWKQEAVKMTHEFFTKILGIPQERLAATCFKGDEDAPKDIESEQTYLKLGFPKEKIAFLGKEDNFWGPAGKTGPCGPNTEMFYWKLNSIPIPKVFDVNDENWLELGNNVLMQYIKNEKGEFKEQEQKTIDFGGGVERIIVTLNGLEDNYEADMWKPIIEKIEKVSNKKYEDNKRAMRIIADHIKASAFIIADGVTPSNTDQGYILRRLIRRAVRQGKILGIKNFTKKIAEPVFEIYDDYLGLQEHKENVMKELDKEENNFLATLEKGLTKFNKFASDKKELSGEDAFLLYQSYGFPIEMTEEMAKEKGIKVDIKGFNKKFGEHQDLSRTAAEGKFKSGLADDSEATTKLHTATHLLMAALRIVLKDEHIVQKGSNITPERARLDFNFDRKMTGEEKKQVEDLVNARIQCSCEIIHEEMTPQEAKEKGAIGVFDGKYGDKVSVYSVDDFSSEICAGPHVKNTCELGHFKIKKEESSSSGVRRIKGVLE
ncbi:alanine--tRNA ligase [Candidatus Pacearchaeota archaeon]|nr:alanine--tRNA ligase [Candidatus Pacearchaeota archaeon]